MSMMRKIFRPGKGATLARYVTAVAEVQTFPNEWVELDPSATSGAGPGADGVFEGETLGTNDFIYVRLLDTDNNASPGLQLGVCMGAGINSVSDFSSVADDSVAADNVMVIQSFGVHQNVRTDGGMLATVEYCIPGTDAGIIDMSATIGASDWGCVGVGLATADPAYTGRATTDTGGPAFIRCDG